ncbi:LysR substrate-binding domain-containing protein [Marinobacterium rhizophilum]|uniref:LysR family transcriptional regulator n=1 Tax=Marinobacterium rhizophilum TaxID=420402 RepID=A0ABY5HFN7_9GAMM|nr:LysR substrate-binding domain-containing protein [Marinobacterium rhizophilum]UTW11175.1 LysR family transcriptional regulator [Marinobacterium rhizophilum]
MEIKWLKDIVALSENGSFSKAAEARFVTQPAFSRRIRSLENWLGVRLIDRNRYPTTLTPEGLEFVDEARRMIADTYATRDRLRLREEQHQTLQFFAQHSLAVSFFPSWIRNIESLVNDSLVRLEAGNLHDMIEAFHAGMGDFLLSFASPVTLDQLERDDIESMQVGTDRLIPVTAVDDAGQPRHNLSPDTAMKLLAYPDDSFLGELVKRECLSQLPAGMTYRPIFESALAEGLKALVLQGQGMAWLPASLIRHELEHGLLCSLEAPLPILDLKILLYRFKNTRTPEADRFWNYILELYNLGYS